MGEVRWSPRALASLTAQDDWLRLRNPAAADAVLTEIERLFSLIADCPQIGGRIEGTRLRYHVTFKYCGSGVYRYFVQITDARHFGRNRDKRFSHVRIRISLD